MSAKIKTREQIIAELDELRRENNELKLALKNQDRSLAIAASDRSTSAGQSFPACDNNHEFNYSFSELVDIPLLQQLLESLYLAAGIPCTILDAENNIFLCSMGWQDICTQFHRVCPQTECRCGQSDSYIADHLYEGQYIGYKCLNGLVDYATPIILEGRHLATVFHGQFLHEPPDEDFFRRQAQAYGFDEAAYLEALSRVPIIPKEQTGPVMEFFSCLGRFLATAGLERKRQLEAADRTLREQQERLNQVWQMSNDGFYDWNIDTDEVYYSPRWAEIYGYPLEEIEPHLRTWERHIHPDDLPVTMKAIDEHLEGRTPKYEAVYRVLTKTGEWKWIMARGQVVAKDAAGRPRRMVGIIIDSTALKKAEAALLQSERKFYRAFQCNPDPVALVTLDEGRFVDINDAFVKIIGYERPETIGRTSHDLGFLVFPEDRNRMAKQIQENGSVREFQHKLRLKSGEIRDFCLSAEIMELDGEPHLFLVSRDITERKQMEEALRLSEARFSKAFYNNPIMMSISTLDEGRFIKVNQAFCRAVGRSCDEIIDWTSLEIEFWAVPAEREMVRQSLRAGQVIRDMEIIFCKKTGEQRRGLYSGERININGESCIISAFKDITELRKMETEINRLDRLNLVGQIAAGIGHEIRNPMTTVRGFLQILRAKKEYIQEMEWFDLMIEELDRANSIITEFLSLANKKMTDMKPGNINLIIEKSMPLIQARARSRDQCIKLELNDLPDLPLDEKEIRQLIINLVNNGLDAMSSAGSITMKTFVEKRDVVLAVQDQGSGINPEFLDQLGTPFFTTKEQGTGLGLSVCYRIANRHNAKIDLETGSAGTTFYVRFANSIAASA